MAKLMKRSRVAVKQQETTGIPFAIFKGVMMSLGVSVILAILLSVFVLLVENTYVEQYLNYFMVAVTLVSIFCGSVYATQKVGARGLLIGAVVGGIYIIISVAIGMELNKETISLLVFANKFAAGIAVGALGGLLGVNL